MSKCSSKRKSFFRTLRKSVNFYIDPVIDSDAKKSSEQTLRWSLPLLWFSLVIMSYFCAWSAAVAGLPAGTYEKLSPIPMNIAKEGSDLPGIFSDTNTILLAKNNKWKVTPEHGDDPHGDDPHGEKHDDGLPGREERKLPAQRAQKEKYPPE